MAPSLRDADGVADDKGVFDGDAVDEEVPLNEGELVSV